MEVLTGGVSFIVDIGMWDGVFRLKIDSSTSAITYDVSFRNMVADATLSKYTVVLLDQVVLLLV